MAQAASDLPLTSSFPGTGREKNGGVPPGPELLASARATLQTLSDFGLPAEQRLLAGALDFWERHLWEGFGPCSAAHTHEDACESLGWAGGLPEGAEEGVFEALSETSIKQARLVCKEWKRIMRSRVSSHKCNATMSAGQLLELGPVLGGVVIGSAIVRSLPGLQSLNLTFHSRADEQSDKDDERGFSSSPGAVFRQLAALKSLTDLTLDQIRLNDSDLKALAMLTGLRRLDICWAEPPDDADSDDDDDSLGPRAVAKLGTSLTGLVELSLRGLRDAPWVPHLMRAAGSLPALETLSVAGANDILTVYHIAADDLAALIDGGAPSHLKKLSVTGMLFDNDDDDDFEPAILQALTNLESLEFHSNSSFSRKKRHIPAGLLFPCGLQHLAISGLQMKSLRHVPKSLTSLKLDDLPRGKEDAAHLRGLTALDIGLSHRGSPDWALFPNLKRVHISSWDDGDIYHLKLPAAVDDFGIQWPPMTTVHLDELYGFLERHRNQITSLHIYPSFSCGVRPSQNGNPRVPHLMGCIRTLPRLSCLRACVWLPSGKTLKEATRKLKEATRRSNPNRPTIELYGQL